MRFIVSSTALSGHLQAVSRVINSKNALPILDCFLFDLQDGTLSVTASDSETTLVTSLEVNESDADGRFAVTAKTLLDALKEIPEQPLSFEINLETLEINVQYQNGKYSLMAQNADEFPQLTQLGDNAVRVEIDAQVLLNGINRSVFATADDELRPVMNGIYFDITTDDITMVASDGHKLVRCKTLAAHGNERAAFILPKKPANLLKNLLAKEQGQVVIEFDERNAVFTLEGYRMVCRLIEGRYPNYNSVIPQNNPYKVTVDRQSLIGALRRVSIFSSQASSLIKLRLSKNQITISAQDIDFSTSAEETQICQYEGNDMSIGFKSTFLLDILNNISAEEVVIELADPSRAGVIIPVEQEENEDLLMLLMPMMLND
ncbi:MAG TPA: DNA polymerase III subunit beta [Mediterranea massiliensis]|uniref:Beta sliding clamp n=1 Tax=Mediterranea massiliensis TaxID=1841865 RepID=A0A921HUQ2_9BACT|nr:DNA polymerase III subunit beta [Mediterranea massiliensis]MBM6735153.1 DNA polymerase III subunit beta [Mediterranea massiliensis]CCZ48626.1 dNA polymerase III subunit beta [Bacteroides sp. CAG:661]HJF90767.1 DNA polymerase III subunit beta [Mediterranea massiliensis]